MSRSDRDRSFEQALARHFSSASLHDAPGPRCPDAETLAAYHENALAPQDLLSWKQHFTTCSRCQELLKHLEASDNIVLEPLEVERPAALARPSYPVIKTRKSWLSLERVSYWRWVLPAGALAAGLLVWVAIRQRQSFYVEMAKNQTASPTQTQPVLETDRAVNPPKAPAIAEAPGTAPAREADQAPAQSSSKALDRLSAADASKTSVQGAPEKRASVASRANLQPTVPSPVAGDRHDQNAARAYNAREPERKQEDFFYRDSLQRPKVKARAAEHANAVADLRKEADGVSVAAPPLPKAMAQSLTAPSGSPSARLAPGGVAGTPPEEMEKVQSARNSNSALELRVVSEQSPATILTPDGRILWRVGVAGRIERSADGGKSWVAQRSPVALDLLAGSAVSDQVCWIVGHAGTILRTTDGGAHWLKLLSPSAHDLSAVRATDAQQAVIFDTTKQRSYKTTDGGARWTELPPE